MRSTYSAVCRVLCALGLFLALPVYGFEIGDKIELDATSRQGVPLHERGESSLFDRAKDGLHAEVVAIGEQNWLQIRLDDGRVGWVVRKYVKPLAPVAVDRAAEVWGSPEGCTAAFEAGDRMPADDPDALRVAAWNIRWFPLGCHPGEECEENATDIDWLACTIAWMDLDLLGVQEILDDSEAIDELRTELDRLTGGSWDIDLQDCGDSDFQRVGFLWNSDRVELELPMDVWEANGRALSADEPCWDRLRPGRYARAKSTTENGVDFQVLSVHLDSGVNDRDFQTRRVAIDRLDEIQIGDQSIFDIEQDIVILGDFNTMGTRDIRASLEIRDFPNELAPDLRLATNRPACTEYYEGRGGTLDYAVVSKKMQEAAANARVTGYCAVENCAPLPSMPAAFETLSDHCPVVFEIRDEDDDEEINVLVVDPDNQNNNGGNNGQPPIICTDEPTDLDAYYASVDAGNAQSLRQTLHNTIDDHKRFPYTASTTDTWDIIAIADQDPDEPERIVTVYKNVSYPKQFGGAANYNREHSWPKSHGFKKDGHRNYPYTDVHHLFASDVRYNGSRGNKPYGDCASCGALKAFENNEMGGERDDVNRTNDDVWETWPERRGDVARAMFYMDLRYEGGSHSVTGFDEPNLILTNDASEIQSSSRNRDEGHMGLLDDLLEWHRQDPVDDMERRRNEVIFCFQENRNPFVDRPEWVDCVYGGDCD